MIENLMYLLLIYIAVVILGLLAYLLIFVAGYFEKKEEIRERRAEIRATFKREINELRADDGVYSEIIESKGA